MKLALIFAFTLNLCAQFSGPIPTCTGDNCTILNGCQGKSCQSLAVQSARFDAVILDYWKR